MSPIWNLIDEKPYVYRPVSNAQAVCLSLAAYACILVVGIVIGATFDQAIQGWLGW